MRREGPATACREPGGPGSSVAEQLGASQAVVGLGQLPGTSLMKPLVQLQAQRPWAASVWSRRPCARVGTERGRRWPCTWAVSRQMVSVGTEGVLAEFGCRAGRASLPQPLCLGSVGHWALTPVLGSLGQFPHRVRARRLDQILKNVLRGPSKLRL